MTKEEQFERRLAALEREVATLRAQHAVKPDDDWIARISGSVTDDEAYVEAMALGRAYRESGVMALQSLPEPIKSARFEIKKSGNSGEFFFSLKAGNGEIILTSEMYKAKASAQSGIDSVKKYSSDDGMFERKKSSGGQQYFVLKSANGEVLGRSQMYAADVTMEMGIESVKKNGPTAEINDLTTN